MSSQADTEDAELGRERQELKDDIEGERRELADIYVKRGVEPDLAPTTLEAGPVRMDVERHVVSVHGEKVAMPLKEFELLEMLLRNTGRVLTRGQLIDRVWGADYVGDTKTLDVHIKRLRAKVEPDPSEPRRIVTIRGLGYKYEAPRT